MSIKDQFEEKIMFVEEFLKAERPWASNLCDHWANQKNAAKQPLKLFETTKKFRIQAEKKTKPARGHAHGATLQRTSQNNQNRQDQKTSTSKSTSKSQTGQKCLCGEAHNFKNCPYMHTNARSSGLKKKNKQLKDEMRKKIRTSEIFRAIKSATNTDILEGVIETMIKKKLKRKNFNKSNDSNGRSSAELRAKDSTCSFANTVTENYSIHSVVHESCAEMISFGKSNLMITTRLLLTL